MKNRIDKPQAPDISVPENLLPGAEPIFISQSRISLIFFHGFTSSPMEGKRFAEHFAEKGYTVWVPLLPGHGTIPSDLMDVKWKDWYQTGEDCYLNLKSQSDKVIVCGQSMGGALALNLATHFRVDALVTLAAAVFLNDWRLKLLPYAKMFFHYQYKSRGPDVFSIEAKKSSVSYNKYPLKSLEQLLLLLKHTKNHLEQVSDPILLMHSKRDHTVTYKNLDYIYTHISSVIKEKESLENSYHVISMDIESKKIFRSIDNFLERLGLTP
jgi:carboxylesterase